MSEYKELVAELKELAEEEKEFASNSGDIYCAEKLALAADAIEQLVKERDAAVADITNIVHDMSNTCICDYCVGCKKDGHYDECKTDEGDNWKWRGVQEDNE